MPPRSLLRKHLAEAWKKTIDEQYSNQLINSERGLQVYFCKHLLDQFKDSNASRRLFIEPRLTIPDSKESKYPDIVICHTRRIIGVVEIKYLPRTQPFFEKDLRTLDWILHHEKHLVISNNRYRGEHSSSKEYSLAKDAVLCWAGVYTGTKAVIALTENNRINQRLFALHAITSDRIKAVVPTS